MNHIIIFKDKPYLGNKEQEHIKIISKDIIDGYKCIPNQNYYKIELKLNKRDEFYIPKFKVLINNHYYSVLGIDKTKKIVYITALYNDIKDNNKLSY